MTGERREAILVCVWGVGCLVGGVFLLVTRARAAGLALLGAVVGAYVGGLMASDLDALPTAATTGATIGNVAVGSVAALASVVAGTHGAPRRIRSAWVAMAVAVVAAIPVVCFLDASRCGIDPRLPCLPDAPAAFAHLFAFDALFVAALLVVEAVREGLSGRRNDR